MYEAFYGLSRAPFQVMPDPRFLYFTACHKQAYVQILESLRKHLGIVLLSGAAGTGKTTLFRAVVRDLDTHVQSALLSGPLADERELLQKLCTDFGLATDESLAKTEYVIQLHDFLRSLDRHRASATLLIDEAHKLNAAVLEEACLLANFEAEHGKPLQLCLAGEPVLLESVREGTLPQLAQRIVLFLELKPLTLTETNGYVKHRLGIAGSQLVGDVFTEDAVQCLHEFSKGIPRQINILCEQALVLGFARRVKSITSQIVQEIASNRLVAAPTPATAGGGGSGSVGPLAQVVEDEDDPWNVQTEMPDRDLLGTAHALAEKGDGAAFPGEVDPVPATPNGESVFKFAFEHAQQVQGSVAPAQTGHSEPAGGGRQNQTGEAEKHAAPRQPRPVLLSAKSVDDIAERIQWRIKRLLLEEYILIKRPKGGAIFPLITILILSYLIAILISAAVIGRLQ